jgi:ferric-dicitrate binding protein FerR (iron transport regulator)
MKETDQIPEYVFACLNGTADEQQKALAEKWLEQDENRLAFEQITKINKLAGDLKLFERFDLTEGKISVENQIQKGNISRVLSTIRKIAAMLLLPVLVFAGWHYFQNLKLKQDFASIQVFQEVKTQPGVRSHFFLPDGTEVWLNAASTLKFPSVFTGNARMVELDGEAYFEVFQNKEKPFLAKTGRCDVAALGTAFNLCAYSEDNQIAATLAEGKIEVTTKEGKQERFILDPNEQLNLEKDISKISKTKVNVCDVIAWKDGKLIFNETPFQEVVLKLGRWFNTDIKLVDQSLAKYRYTATFTNEDLSQVLELLELSAPIEFTSTKRRITENSDFARKQIIIRAKPDSKIKSNKKDKEPMD